MYRINWEVDGSSGSTECAGILVDGTILDLLRAGYVVQSIERID